jgi:RNA recognition motif-containing protein
MDKISKRSKGYAFIEYTTEEAGGAALKAMNGQVGDLNPYATASVFTVLDIHTPLETHGYAFVCR